jgi:hypothetical protein
VYQYRQQALVGGLQRRRASGRVTHGIQVQVDPMAARRNQVCFFDEVERRIGEWPHGSENDPGSRCPRGGLLMASVKKPFQKS